MQIWPVGEESEAVFHHPVLYIPLFAAGCRGSLSREYSEVVPQKWIGADLPGS